MQSWTWTGLQQDESSSRQVMTEQLEYSSKERTEVENATTSNECSASFPAHFQVMRSISCVVRTKETFVFGRQLLGRKQECSTSDRNSRFSIPKRSRRNSLIIMYFLIIFIIFTKISRMCVESLAIVTCQRRFTRRE